MVITSVNFHILEQCNMRCSHCFCTDIGDNNIKFDEHIQIIKELEKERFKKINFAGGEPMLYPKLNDLIRMAKECNLTTSIVTNGTKIDDNWLSEICRYLDWIALSVDSDNSETNIQSGRATKSDHTISKEEYLGMCKSIKRYGIRLKINTVVTRYNWNADLSGFIKKCGPERWKVMQVLPMKGQNDGNIGYVKITEKQFDEFLKRNESVKQDDIKVVPENNSMMKGTYVMINPEGRFVDNTCGEYRYSSFILSVGVKKALREIDLDNDKFVERGGVYQ